MISDKLRSTHLDRKAVVYLRQSTAQQVVSCKESTQRQYALAGRAGELGWPAQRVEVIDEDLGRSGAGTAWRSGFQQLAKEVAEGRVGAVFALEVSRFARNSADWHQLLDLCGWASALIVDEQSVYDPRDPNDRLLLGLKGQMSEAERYWMRLRLQGGKMSKARRGELQTTAPIGYVWDDATKRFELDPDERVRDAVALVFERFRIDGSGTGVLRYLVRHDIVLPHRPPGSATVQWGRPNRRAIFRILHSPFYAGAYVHGRRESRPVVEDGRLVGVRAVSLPEAEWKVCIPDRHPAYLSWKEFMDNQAKLEANRSDFEKPARRGAAREGAALLQGIVLCGRCGKRMQVSYPDAAPRYECRAGAEHEGRNCWSVLAEPIDRGVAERFLGAADPPEVDLCLAVAREAERQAAEVERQWKHRIEQVSYEARLAERRYMAVDPDNRTVARTLEQRWEEKLREKEEVERAFERARAERRVDIGPAEQARIIELARDLRRVWDAATTTHDQRKNMLRVLIQEVSLAPRDEAHSGAKVAILWETGAVERFEVVYRTRISADVLAFVATSVAKGLPSHEIAEELNAQGHLTARQQPWTECAVKHLRGRIVEGRRPPDAPPVGARRRADGLYSTRAVAERFEVSIDRVNGWVRRGLLAPEPDASTPRKLWFRLDEATVERIEREGAAPIGRPNVLDRRADGCFSVQGLANLMGVTPSRVRNWMRSGLIEPADPTRRGVALWFRLDEATERRLRDLVARHPPNKSR